MGKPSQNIFEWIDKVARAHVAQIQKYIDKKRYDAIVTHSSSYKGCDYKVSIRVLSSNEFVVTAYPAKKCITLIGLNGDIRKQSEFNSATKYYQINNGASLYDNPDRYAVMLPNGKEYHEEEESMHEEIKTVINTQCKEDIKAETFNAPKVTNTLDEDDYTDIEDETFTIVKTPSIKLEDELLKLAVDRSIYELLFSLRVNKLDINKLTYEELKRVDEMASSIAKDTVDKIVKYKKSK